MSTKTPPGTQTTLPGAFERVRPGCGHAAVYQQDGECMVCEPHFNTAEERAEELPAVCQDCGATVEGDSR